ncbi:winged helix-turn-helix domain-containing protein, partial [Nocardioides aquaticus]|uniref:winged helix-turn-helix domain-containing protein n=1 Tax=Nocardioides aquaticus TaxID=160826 RepID=UPI0031D9F835
MTLATPPRLPVRLDRTAAAPLPAQLADRVRALGLAGTLRAGDRLPSSRALASELAVSRAVTAQAYEQLVAEGWLEGRHGSGTFVAPTAPADRPTTAPRARPAPSAPPDRLVRLDAGTPWIDPRHAAGWRRAWREVSTATPPRGY